MRSPPAPPLSVSTPVPPWITSAPSPVVMVSLPGPASIVVAIVVPGSLVSESSPENALTFRRSVLAAMSMLMLRADAV